MVRRFCELNPAEIDLSVQVLLLRNSFVLLSILMLRIPSELDGQVSFAFIIRRRSNHASRTLRTPSSLSFVPLFCSPPTFPEPLPRAPQAVPLRLARTPWGRSGLGRVLCARFSSVEKERVSTRVNEMPRRRPVSRAGRSINLQVQSATALCGRHSCPTTFIPKAI